MCDVNNIMLNGVPVFLCTLQTARWKWRRRAWSSAPWGQGRCLESWLFSTTAPGLPLSRVSLHRHLEKHPEVLCVECTHTHTHTLKSAPLLWRIRGLSACKISGLRRHRERDHIATVWAVMMKHYTSLLRVFTTIQLSVLRDHWWDECQGPLPRLLHVSKSSGYEGCTVGE